MPRIALLLVTLLVAVTACGRPLAKARNTTFARGITNIGKGLVAMVKPVTPKVDVRVRMAVLGAVQDQAQLQATAFAAQATAPAPQVVVDQAPRRRAQPAPRRAEPAATPTITTVRHSNAKPTVFALKGRTYGKQTICEVYDSMATCTSTCTAKLRVAAFDPQAKSNPSVTESCGCHEQDGGC